MNHVSVFNDEALRHCTADQMNRAMQQDPAAAAAFAGEQAQEAAAAKRVYHPSAAEFLRRQRNGEAPFVPLSG